MKISKIIFGVVGILAVGCCITACNSKKSGNIADGKDSGGITEVTVPTYLAGENVGAVFFLPHIERFNQKYAGKYKINIEAVPQASYAEQIKQLAQQNKLPVLVHSAGSGGIDVQWFKNVIVRNNMEYDLSDFINSDPAVKANLVPESLDYCTVDGKIVCMPIAVLKPVGLYYNTALYAPEKAIGAMSMQEFITSLGKNRFAFQTVDNGWTTGLFLSALVAGQPGGLELVKDAVDTKLYDYTGKPIVDAVTQLQKIMQTNAASNSIGAAYADAANAFMSDKAAVICNGSWMASEFDSSSSDKWSNGFNGSDVRAAIYPGNIALVNPRVYGEFWVPASATEKEKELACAYLAFRDSQPEIEQLILTEGGTAPGISKYSDEFTRKQQETPVLAQLAQSVNKDTVFAVSLYDVMPSTIADTEFGKMLPKLIDRSLSPEEFCSELTKKAEETK
ncbi:MAG: ABC transporter substrate-binding protein [Treponema sp.]|jgi:raffinose/stachyose/melibiose transport system substrate-binding protein|nr:ABC transporter substrate-binding protein [Treponema sp.]